MRWPSLPGSHSGYELATAVALAALLAACGAGTNEPAPASRAAPAQERSSASEATSASEASRARDGRPAEEPARSGDPDAAKSAPQELPSLEQAITARMRCEYRCKTEHETCAVGSAASAPSSARGEPAAPPPACFPFCAAAPADSANAQSASCDDRRDACMQRCADAAPR